MKTLYTAVVTAIGGRNGHVKSDNGILDMDVKMPVALGGQDDNHINPEQLFAAGYASCFGSALDMIIANANIQPEGPVSITAKVGLGPSETGGFALTAQLLISIPGVQKEKAQELTEKAHQTCPYSNAIKGNIDVVLNVQ